jgi:hypothetical protein
MWSRRGAIVSGHNDKILKTKWERRGTMIYTVETKPGKAIYVQTCSDVETAERLVTQHNVNLDLSYLRKRPPLSSRSTKHTPEPWKYALTVQENGPSFYTVATRTFGGQFIAKVEKEADARLITASPRLLKALAKLAAYANGKIGRNPYGIDEYKEALQAIGEAIGYTGDWMDTLDKVKE